ncbi:MAG: TraX family protein [Pseudomonadota bacterium]
MSASDADNQTHTTGVLFTRGFGAAPTSTDLIKLLAVITMVVDHLGYFFFPDELWWRAVGRLSAPIWLFMIGYADTRTVPGRLWVGAGILVLLDLIIVDVLTPLNILFTMALIRFALPVIEHRKLLALENYLPFLAIMVVLTPPSWFAIEYGTLAIIFACFGLMIRRKVSGVLLWVTIIALAIIYAGWQRLYFEFDDAQTAFVAIGTASLLIALTLFKRVPLSRLAGMPIVAPILRFTGRYTLEIYVVHIMVFGLIARFNQGGPLIGAKLF